jgi:hypothetical protein
MLLQPLTHNCRDVNGTDIFLPTTDRKGSDPDIIFKYSDIF